MRYLLITLCILLVGFTGNYSVDGQTQRAVPKLVLGIVADPMGHDWINKYWEYLGPDGLKKLVEQGTSFENTNLNHFLAGTGPSHASISTGTTPYQHGIIADSWYDRLKKEEVSCTRDFLTRTIGSNSQAGKHSLKQLLTPTFGDALKGSVYPKSKVISIALKPEAAMIMGGHLADGCFWFDTSSGNWVTSSVYSENLPSWVNNMNNRSRPDAAMLEDWDLYLSESNYVHCNPDDQEYEFGFFNNFKVFPYKLKKLKRESLNQDYEILMDIPAGNSLTTEMAISAFYNERLGLDSDPDLLLVSYSAISGLVNRFGPESREVMDAIIRLDTEITRLLLAIEERIGNENLLVFFTATHGSSWNVDYSRNIGLPAGRFRSLNAIALTNSYLSALYGDNQWIENYINQQVYLDQTLVDQKELSLPEIQEKTARFLNQFDGVASALPADKMINASIINHQGSIIQNSFYPSRSGDILIILKPGWIEDGEQVADYQSPYSYDTRVPLIWWGMNIPSQKIQDKTGIQDIAATIIQILKISYPTSGTGRSLFPQLQQNQ